MRFEQADDINQRAKRLVEQLQLNHIDAERVVCIRSYGSKSRANARIWSLPRIWQQALNIKAHYVIEVLSEKFDNLSFDDQERTLIHELLHIPKTFSGALVPHLCFGKRIDSCAVERLFKMLRSCK